MIGRIASALAPVILATTACGTERAPGASTQADDLRAACGSVNFSSVPPDLSEFSPWDEAEDPVDLVPIEPEREFFDWYDWFVASRSRTGLTLFGMPHEPVVEGPEFASAELFHNGDAWVPSSWGQCRIEVSAPGWGYAAFVLDPDAEPDPAATEISVLAWERACASGGAPNGRHVQPVVLAADESSVSIVVLVEPVTGGADCPSNPSFPLEIELDSALGDRVLLDASVQPARERPWPPTQSSLDSTGLTD